MKAWFHTLTTRERAVVVLGTLVAALLLVYVGLVEPVGERFRAQRARVEALETDLAWMRSVAPRVTELRRVGPVASPGDDGQAPYLAVDQALRRAGLSQPQRLEPAGADGARVEFEAVAFDPLISVLARLRRESGLQVTRARFGALEPGTVSARVTLERAAR